MNTRNRMTLTCTGLVLCFAFTAPPAKANLLVDPGFESNPLTSYANVLGNFTGYQGQWGVEVATITGVDGGVTPAQGTKMLRMVDDGLVATQAFQATDVNSYAGLIDSGGATVNLSALFNAGPNVPAGIASVVVRFFSTANWSSAIGTPAIGGLALDSSPDTWEGAFTSVSVPVGTRWLISEVAFNNASLFGNPGYVDAARLIVTPEPASIALVGLAAGGICRRRRSPR